jgi:hypothetical protein
VRNRETPWLSREESLIVLRAGKVRWSSKFPSEPSLHPNMRRWGRVTFREEELSAEFKDSMAMSRTSRLCVSFKIFKLSRRDPLALRCVSWIHGRRIDSSDACESHSWRRDGAAAKAFNNTA